jgi:cytochrome c oxidase assembly factor CtaG
MNIFRQALQDYAKKSDVNLAGVFALVAALASGLTILYVLLFGRYHADNLWLRYLAPLVLLAAGLVFVYIARSIPDPWARLGYAIMAIFLLFGAIASFIVTLLLFAFI